MSSVGAGLGTATPLQVDVKQTHEKELVSSTGTAESAGEIEAAPAPTGFAGNDTVDRGGSTSVAAQQPPPQIQGERSKDATVLSLEAWTDASNPALNTGDADVAETRARSSEAKSKFEIKKLQIEALQTTIKVTREALKGLREQIAHCREQLSNPKLEEREKAKLNEQLQGLLTRSGDIERNLKNQGQTLEELRHDCSSIQNSLKKLTDKVKEAVTQTEGGAGSKSPQDVNRLKDMQKQLEQTMGGMALPAALRLAEEEESLGVAGAQGGGVST